MENQSAWTVSDLTAQIKSQLNLQFSDCYVRGEISELTAATSGHLYFSLKDANAKISAVVWRSTAQRLPFELKNGVEVICQGGIDVYPPRGSYQLIVRSVTPLGAGSLQLAFQQLRAKLEAQGWFSAQRKRSLPKFPRRIGLVTSPQGAAIRDFLQVIDRRWPHLEIVVCPTRVQGQGAAPEIAAAIQAANRIRPTLDLVVLCRGGGSLEDLWCFNEMPVCQAVYSSRLPIVTGIGHEVDVTLADLISDKRALTPTEAAERIVPDIVDIRGQLADQRRRLDQALQTKLRHAQALLQASASRPVLARPLERLQWQLARLQDYQRQLPSLLQRRVDLARRELLHAANRPVLQRPLDSLQVWARRLDEWEMQIQRSMNTQLETARAQVQHSTQQLQSLSPLAVLARGYSVTQTAAGEVLRDSAQTKVGDLIQTRLERGMITSRVEPNDPTPR